MSDDTYWSKQKEDQRETFSTDSQFSRHQLFSLKRNRRSYHWKEIELILQLNYKEKHEINLNNELHGKPHWSRKNRDRIEQFHWRSTVKLVSKVDRAFHLKWNDDGDVCHIIRQRPSVEQRFDLEQLEWNVDWHHRMNEEHRDLISFGGSLKEFHPENHLSWSMIVPSCVFSLPCWRANVTDQSLLQ